MPTELKLTLVRDHITKNRKGRFVVEHQDAKNSEMTVDLTAYLGRGFQPELLSEITVVVRVP